MYILIALALMMMMMMSIPSDPYTVISLWSNTNIHRLTPVLHTIIKDFSLNRVDADALVNVCANLKPGFTPVDRKMCS